MTSPVYVQEDHRWVADDGGVNAGTLQGSGNNEGFTYTVGTDTEIRLRIVVQNTAAKTANNVVFGLFTQKNGSGGYTQVTTTSNGGILLTNDGNSIADHATTSQRIGNGTYTTGTDCEGWNDGQTNNNTGNIDSNGEDEWEIETCLSINSGDVSDADYFDLRIEESDGTDLNTYPGTLPRLTVSAVSTVTGSCGDDLTLTDTAANTITVPQSFPDTVSLDDTVTGAALKSKTVADTLSLDDTVTGAALKPKAVADTLTLTDTAAAVAVTIVTGSVADTLSLTDTAANVASRVGPVADTLSLTDTATSAATKAKAVADALSLDDTATGAAQKPKAVADTLSLTDTAAGPAQKPKSVAEALSLTDAATSLIARPASVADTLALTDTASCTAIRLGVVADALVLTDAGVGQVISDDSHLATFPLY